MVPRTFHRCRDDRPVTEAEADARAEELNRELGRSANATGFYVAVEAAPDEWDVEFRENPKEERGWIDRIWEILLP